MPCSGNAAQNARKYTLTPISTGIVYDWIGMVPAHCRRRLRKLFFLQLQSTSYRSLGHHMRAWVAIVVSLLATGCATRPPSAADLQSVHGPLAGIKLQEQRILCDLNADGRPETIILLQDRRRTDSFRADLGTLRTGLIVDGFVVLDGRAGNVVVFYAYFDGGLALQLKRIDDDLFIVSEGGKDHVQHAWGWWSTKSEWPSAGWAYGFREWNQEREAYGFWSTGPKIFVNQGR